MSLLLNILLFIQISFSTSKDKSFTLTITITDIPRKVLFPLKIGNYEVESIYSGLKTTSSEIFFAFTPKSDCINRGMDKCYNGGNEKNTQKVKKIRLFEDLKEGYVYKDVIQIGEDNLGEIEFLYVDVLYSGYMNFCYRSIDILEDRDVISEKIIYYNSFDEINKSMKVIIGKEYKKKKYYDSCKINDKNSGCVLKEIILSENNINDENKISIDLNTNVEFFNSDLFLVDEKVITGNKTAIEKIKKTLINNGFICDDGKTECQSTKKIMYFVFGEKGIKISKIYLYDTPHPNLIFGFNTLKDVDIVIDYEDDKVLFMTDEKDIIYDIKKGKSLLTFFIIIILIICILGVSFFFIKYRRKTLLSKMKYNDLIDSLDK